MRALAEIAGPQAFDAAVRSGKPVLADFYTPSCAICRKIEPMLAVVAREFADDVLVARIDAEALPDLAAACRVRGVPSLVLLKEGEAVDRKVGFVSAAGLRAWLREHLD